MVGTILEILYGKSYFDVDDAAFERDVLQRSVVVPVAMLHWADGHEPSTILKDLLERLALEYEGRWVLARIRVDADQHEWRDFWFDSVPGIFGVVDGSTRPLFGRLTLQEKGAALEIQVRQHLDRLVEWADAHWSHDWKRLNEL
ncbi:hypothetical protein OG203_16550 [Nocardia sp. NBC_01499]|uniref:hypothetical protein n=1 Tax=Nocardia sp. NBC_01499 TaxID=2903597 RepID=UPI003869DBD9